MNSLRAARVTIGQARLSRRALLSALPILLVVGGATASGQHVGHSMPTDFTPRTRTDAAQRRTWLGIRLGLTVGFLVLYVVWWRYQVVRARRSNRKRKEGHSASPPDDSSHRLPRQRRRR